eukprot:2995357-Amphidinium_carterae.2
MEFDKLLGVSGSKINSQPISGHQTQMIKHDRGPKIRRKRKRAGAGVASTFGTMLRSFKASARQACRCVSQQVSFGATQEDYNFKALVFEEKTGPKTYL